MLTVELITIEGNFNGYMNWIASSLENDVSYNFFSLPPWCDVVHN